MSSAISLKCPRDQIFNAKESPQAAKSYRSFLKINHKPTEVWFKKGLAYKIQNQFSKVLLAFSKAGELHEKRSNTFSEHSLLTSLRDLSASSSQYLSWVCSPLICKPEYLLKLKQFQNDSQEIKEKPFKTQLKLVIQLLQFLQKYLVSTGDSYPFVLQILSHNEEGGRKFRLAIIGLMTALKILPKTVASYPRSWLKDEMDPAFLNLFKTAQDDIYLEDSKKVWKMIFETIHFFPIKKREEFIAIIKDKVLPWEVQSWNLFDFCVAVMRSDETIEQFKKNKSIFCAPYQYCDDNKSWQQSYFFQSLVNHCLITKVACRDLIDEAEPMQAFFIQLLKKNPNAFLKPLPQLSTLIRYSKQLFNTYRLLCILPPSCYNHPMAHPALVEMGFPLNNDSDSKMISFFKSISETSSPIQRKRALHTCKILFLIPITPLEANATPEAVLEQVITDAREYIFPPLKQLKCRLAIIRKLQLIGDTFIPRNWTSEELKRIDFIDTETFCDIRTYLTHLEKSPHYFNLTELLEKDFESL